MVASYAKGVLPAKFTGQVFRRADDPRTIQGMAVRRKREAEWFVTYERPEGGRGMRRLAATSFEKVVRKFKHVHRGEGLRILDVELTAGR